MGTEKEGVGTWGSEVYRGGGLSVSVFGGDFGEEKKPLKGGGGRGSKPRPQPSSAPVVVGRRWDSHDWVNRMQGTGEKGEKNQRGRAGDCA